MIAAVGLMLLGMTGPASAEPVRVRAAPHDGYGRMVFNWTPRKTLTFGGVTPELASGGLPCRPFGPVFRFLMSVSGVSERVFLYPGALRALSQTRRFIL